MRLRVPFLLPREAVCAPWPAYTQYTHGREAYATRVYLRVMYGTLLPGYTQGCIYRTLLPGYTLGCVYTGLSYPGIPFGVYIQDSPTRVYLPICLPVCVTVV